MTCLSCTRGIRKSVRLGGSDTVTSTRSVARAARPHRRQAVFLMTQKAISKSIMGTLALARLSSLPLKKTWAKLSRRIRLWHEKLDWSQLGHTPRWKVNDDSF